VRLPDGGPAAAADTSPAADRVCGRRERTSGPAAAPSLTLFAGPGKQFPPLRAQPGRADNAKNDANRVETGGDRMGWRALCTASHAISAVLDVLAGGQDRHPKRARTDVLLRSADPHAMHKIASLLLRRPHLPNRVQLLARAYAATGIFIHGSANATIFPER
jgi:hypothetical protein